MPKSLIRRKPSRQPKRKLILLCEGKNTEPYYFNALKKTFAINSLIDIQIIPAVGVPLTIAKKACAIAKRDRLGTFRKKNDHSLSSNDQVWAVFDRDDHPYFNKAVQMCESHDIKVAQSNPCFEVWLVLHYQQYHRACDRNQIQFHLSTLCPEYNLANSKVVNAKNLLLKLNDAEVRAAEQLFSREQEGNPYGAPSTTVHLLTQEIRKDF